MDWKILSIFKNCSSCHEIFITIFITIHNSLKPTIHYQLYNKDIATVTLYTPVTLIPGLFYLKKNITTLSKLMTLANFKRFFRFFRKFLIGLTTHTFIFILIPVVKNDWKMILKSFTNIFNNETISTHFIAMMRNNCS